jgi:Flp pilus assembly protein TadB
MELVPCNASPPRPTRRRHPAGSLKEVTVGALVALGIVFIVLWAVLWIGFHIVAGLVHLLIVIGVILLVWGLIKRGARAADRHM